MLAFPSIWAVIWLGGAVLGMPRWLRLVPAALLWVLVFLGHVFLTPPSALHSVFPESSLSWGVAGGAAALIVLYSDVLAWLRARAKPASAGEAPLFSDAELDRYARHIYLREIGGAGQARLKRAKVLVIGAGGLGAPVLQYLGAAGVGQIGVIDDDLVENSNLQRQVIHADARIGTPKALSAADAMRAQNPFINVTPYVDRFAGDLARQLVAESDIIFDGSDNFDTRYLANDLCVAAGKPLVSGALSQWEGQLSIFDPAHGTPCYACVFPDRPAPELAPSCAAAGVLGPLPGIVGSMMAAEGVKLITGAGVPLMGKMLIFDAAFGQSRQMVLRPRVGCPVCGGKGLDAT
jgi:molybdopterin/thiamine biosynthesis adenylyltransferase